MEYRPWQSIPNCRSDTDQIKQEIRSTQIYKYYKEHPEFDKLRKIIKTSKLNSYGHYLFLIHCYEKIIDEGLNMIIDDILVNQNILSNAEIFAIANVAMVKLKYDIVEKIYEQGYDLDKSYDSGMYHTEYGECLLSTAIKQKNVDMCKFLVERGVVANRYFETVKESVSCENEDIFDYFMSFNYNEPYKLQYLFVCCIYLSKDKRQARINKLLNKGLDLNLNKDFDKFLHTMSGYDIDEIQWLVDRGFVVNNELLICAFKYNNAPLVEYLLECGLKFDKHLTLEILTKHINSFLQITTLINYGADFSLVEADNDNYLKLFNMISDKGLNKDVIIACFLQKIEDDYEEKYSFMRGGNNKIHDW